MDTDWEQVRSDFPVLQQVVNEESLVYLDNAATSQKPMTVLQSINQFYLHDNANVHRGIHTLAQRATEQYEAVRDQVRQFINATTANEIIFTKGTTDSLNLVASTYGQFIQAGDEIILTIMEHHSNLIAWQQLALQKHATLKYINLTKEQDLDLKDAAQKITDKTKIVAIAHASNVLGVVNPIKTITKLAHQHGAVVVCDGAQAVAHLPVDVQDLDVDFYAFSGHKMLGPTGIGVLYGKQALLKKMPPYQYGGEMISVVNQYDSTWAELPYKFEAGTPNIAGVIGLGKAIDYLNHIEMTNIWRHEQELVQYIFPKLLADPTLTIYGPPSVTKHTGVIAFNLHSLHPHDVATALDQDGVAVRAGHHCAQPLMNALYLKATVRMSLSFYNNWADLDNFLAALKDTKEFFNHELI